MSSVGSRLRIVSRHRKDDPGSDDWREWIAFDSRRSCIETDARPCVIFDVSWADRFVWRPSNSRGNRRRTVSRLKIKKSDSNDNCYWNLITSSRRKNWMKILPVCVLKCAERLLSRGKTRLQNLHFIAEGDVDPWIIRVVRSSLFGRPLLLPGAPSKLRFSWFSWNLWDSSLDVGDSSGLGSHEACSDGLIGVGLKISYLWKFVLFGVSIFC